MKKWAFIILIAMLSASCDSILKSKPSGTLSEEKMTEVLVDIHLTEATLRIANDSIARKNDTADLRERFAEVFRKHDVTPDEFNSSLNYYLEHVEILQNIYNEVITRLSKMEAGLIQQQVRPAFMSQMFKPNASQLKNKWFRTLYKPGHELEIQYFSPDIYPDK
jgi:hypothetical protein